MKLKKPVDIKTDTVENGRNPRNQRNNRNRRSNNIKSPYGENSDKVFSNNVNNKAISEIGLEQEQTSSTSNTSKTSSSSSSSNSSKDTSRFSNEASKPRFRPADENFLNRSGVS